MNSIVARWLAIELSFPRLHSSWLSSQTRSVISAIRVRLRSRDISLPVALALLKWSYRRECEQVRERWYERTEFQDDSATASKLTTQFSQSCFSLPFNNDSFLCSCVSGMFVAWFYREPVLLANQGSLQRRGLPCRRCAKECCRR